ncbi:MAG TPA: glycosyltransferase [Gammaproteobacteria bacterium]|jgi:glycosyltransferase involved in cell wall biosynthesis|nr:glycosyltransferase [Gammaproteobacteria bacterium]
MSRTQTWPLREEAVTETAERIRLVKFLAMFGVGGTEKQVVNLTKRMDRRSFDLRFACLTRWGALLDEVEGQQGIAVTEYPLSSFYEPNALRQQFRFASALRRDGVQVVHSYNFYGNMFSVPAARLAGVPAVVASIRDMGIYNTPFQLMMQRWVCKLADRVVVNAGAIRDWLVSEGYDERKVVVIRNGVDTSRFGPRGDGAALRREFGLPPRVPLVVMLARLNAKKGIECFIEAAARIHAVRPDACFLAVGEAFTRDGSGSICVDAEYRRELQDKVDELGLAGHFRFTGMRRDVPQVLAAATVSVLTSMSEGISNTLLESMAAGVPVVATRVGGTPELITDRRHGLLVPSGDAQAVANAVRAILDDSLLAERLGRQARVRAVNEFSFEAVVRRTEDLYRGILAGKGMHRTA